MRSHKQIQQFLDANLHRFDLGVQYLGDEPNAYRKDWDSSSVRSLMLASWSYEACVGGDTVVLAEDAGPVRIQSLNTVGRVDCGGFLQASSSVIDSGVREVVRVYAGGRSVVCTPDHRFLVTKPEKWRKHGPTRRELRERAPEVWVEAKNLQPGDMFKVFYGQNIWAADRVRLPAVSGKVVSNSPIRFPHELTPDLAYLLGLMATGSNIRWGHRAGMSSAIRWSADDPGILEALLEIIPEVFGKVPCVVRREGRNPVVELASTPLVRWLRESVGVTERRRVPDVIFASPQDVVEAYLSGIFDGDGCFSTSGRYMPGRPSLSNTERGLIEDVATLLLNRGCPVSGSVRSAGTTPSRAIADLSGFRPIHALHARWSADMDWGWMRLRHSTRQRGLEAWKNYRPKYLRKCLAHEGVSSVEVVSVEPAGEERVWDLSVPDTESFTANGIVVHNSAGNGSIPSVYKTINIAREDSLCDRFYLPATPRDMRLLEKNGIPVFGIESKRALTEFDLVGTSISYPVLTMSFVKMLKMSGIPVRWKDRDASHPFVIFGGQAYAAPEVLAPVVDAVFLGEVEDEPGNPGLGVVLDRIVEFKASGQWTQDRVGCYAALAREFSFLYFPRFVEVEYGYQDRGMEHPSKQVIGHRSTLEGMEMPFRRHYVKELDSIPPLDDPPLLYVDAQNASGDAESGRGCPAWSIPVDARVEVAGRGSVRFDSVVPGEMIRVGSEFHQVAGVVVHGVRDTVRVVTRQGLDVRCTPEHEIYAVRGGAKLRRAQRDKAVREWVHAEDLQPGDLMLRTCGGTVWPQEAVVIEHQASKHYVGRGRAVRFHTAVWPQRLDADVAWLLGMVTGDCIVRRNQVEFRVEDRAPAIRERLIEILKVQFDIDVTEKPSASGSCTHIRANSARLVRWLSDNFGIAQRKEFRKFVPPQIFGSPRDVVGAYLSALFDSNGTALRPTTLNSSITIRYAVYAERQITEVAELLRLLGLPCAIRSTELNVKRDGTPSDGLSVKWEVRTIGSDDPEAYTWLESLEPFKSKDLESFRPPAIRATCQNHLQYVEVVGVEPDQPTQVMDVDVPGPQAFNVSGIYVHNCSFCRLSLVTKPYRQRSPEYMVEFGKSLKRNMGGTHIAYVAPDFPFHNRKKTMTKALLENVTDEVDGAAMRVDDFIEDEQFVMLSSFGGMDSVTLGLEGSSQRMRDLVGKGISDVEVRETVTKALEAGVRKIKLFMISNLPGEDWGDIKQVVRLAEDLAQIRDSMNKPHVVIQLSWTPLLIEANTPFQWFAPTPANYALADAWKELKDLRIDAKIGAKAQVDKVTFFQLCQRASREIGEAMVDTMLELDVACWGGVPRRMRELLDENMRKWGFLNGLEDAFDERGKDDLFGWEFIDTGVSKDLLWSVYRQMVEFLEYTDSDTYDELVGDDYHGAEWVARCDERCQGTACGACDRKDLEIRQEMLANGEDDQGFSLGEIRPIDERSVAMKIRARVDKPVAYRLVTNDHWRFNLRRALYRAKDSIDLPANIAKRTIVFASDAIGYKDWTHGTDYVEFGLTQQVPQDLIGQFLEEVNKELVNPATDQAWMQIGEWVVHPPTSPSIRTDLDLTLYEVEVEEIPEKIESQLRKWEEADTVDMTIRAPVTYFGPPTEVVNAKEYVDGIWMVKDGHRVTVRMLVRGRPTPYNVFAALMGQKSWLEVAKYPARRVDSFVSWDEDQQDFFRPTCHSCGASIPVNVLEEPFDPEYCPRCKDSAGAY